MLTLSDSSDIRMIDNYLYSIRSKLNTSLSWLDVIINTLFYNSRERNPLEKSNWDFISSLMIELNLNDYLLAIDKSKVCSGLDYNLVL